MIKLNDKLLKSCTNVAYERINNYRKTDILVKHNHQS